MKDLVYLVIDFDGRAEEYITDYKTLEEANTEALEVWAGYSRDIKKTAKVYVMAITKEDYLKVKNDETESWYGDFEVNIDEDRFDSDLVNGFGYNQEIAYWILNGNEELEEEKIYDNLEEAKAKVEELHEKWGKYYYIVEVGKKDAELVFNYLTDVEWWKFIKDFAGIFSTDDRE